MKLPKKLSLSTETLRHLNPGEVQGVDGGTPTRVPDSRICTIFRCPTVDPFLCYDVSKIYHTLCGY